MQNTLRKSAKPNDSLEGRRRRWAVGRPALELLAWFSFAPAAFAQAAIEPPSPYNPIDNRGVNLANGSLSVGTTEITIGDLSQGGLTFSANFNTASGQQWRHSLSGGIQKRPYTGPDEPYATYTVTVMGTSTDFTPDGFGNFVLVDGVGTLTKSGSIYNYTAPDGQLRRF